MDEYVEKFAATLSEIYDVPVNRHMTAMARSHYRGLLADPEGDARLYHKNMQSDHNPIEELTRKYHEELRELLMREAREEIRASI